VADRLTVICETSQVTAHDVSAAIGGGEVAIELSAARQFERERLVELLAKNEWNTARVAEQTGVNRTTIYRRMLRLGITPPRFQWGLRTTSDTLTLPAVNPPTRD
jgi:transcriptional regulator of acetoin/glycerol metabolism